MKKFLVGLLIFGLTLTIFHTYLSPKFPYTNDGENHLARFANYKIALKEGQIPPRFAPNLMNHYGYPVFNFNYPLPNILSVPFSLFKINPELSFKLISVISYLFGLIGVYKLMQIRKESLFVLVVALLLFGLNPYITNVVLFRGSIGELLAISFFPWLLWSIEKIALEMYPSIFFSVIIWSGFLLSHNVTVLLMSLWLLPYIILKVGKNKQFWMHFFPITILSACLSAWFWLPAVFESNQTVVTETGIANQLTGHFPNINELLFGQLGFGFSYFGPVDSLSFQLGFPQIAILLISTLIFLKLLFHRQKTEFINGYLIFSTFFIVVLQLPHSNLFWQIFPFLKIIQFPWRLSILLVIIIPLLWSNFSIYYARSLKKSLVFLTIVYCFMLNRLYPVDFFHRDNIDYDLYPQSTSTQNENRTKEFNYTNIGDWQPSPSIIGDGRVQVEHWTGSDRLYRLQLRSDSLVIEPTMNFIGWKTQVKKNDEQPYTAAYIHNDQIQGRLAFQLPAGTYQISSQFTQNTPARLIGNGISLVGILVLACLFMFEFFNTKIFQLHEKLLGYKY